MATMIPDKPRKFDPASLEGIMFEALENLPIEYYVFHSFRITDVVNNVLGENETDFIIYHPDKGVICLEAKAGQVKYLNGEWLYGSGVPMHNGGPFNQASNNKYKLMKHIANSKLSGVLDHCKFLHAVWFPSISEENLKSMILPSEGDKKLVMTKEALSNPEPFIEKIYAIDIYSRGEVVKTDISEAESRRLVREIFCPEFEVFPAAFFESELKKIVFHRLLKEQAVLLNYLEEQKTAAINGAAGTGKTMIALEKARRHAADGEKVLFLCFNSQLKEYLEEHYANENIAFYTIAGFVCKTANSSVPDYRKATEILEDMYIAGSFPYNHVIIDEGQDFGIEEVEDASIIQLIYSIIKDDEESEKTFYVFYDRLQLIQARKMPGFINELDCKLTLYRNCRNTENIATTSLRPITERKPKLYEGSIPGTPAKIHYCINAEDECLRIDGVIDGLLAEGFKDITILTCKTEATSVLSQSIKNGRYRNKCLFTTCRKFKGLESDAVILVDVDIDTFVGENVLVYYVGASRARLKLDVMAALTDQDCEKILGEVLHYTGKISKPKRDLAGALNAQGTLKY